MYFEFSYVCSPKYFYSNQRSLHSTWQTPSCHVKLRGVKDSAEESDSAVFKILSYYIQIMNESWDQMSLNQEKTKAKTFKHLLIPRCQRHRRRFLHMQISPRNLKHIWKYFSIFNKLSGRLEKWRKKSIESSRYTLSYLQFFFQCSCCSGTGCRSEPPWTAWQERTNIKPFGQCMPEPFLVRTDIE